MTKATRILILCGMIFFSLIVLVPNAAAHSVSFTIQDPNIIGFADPTSCGGLNCETVGMPTI
jgi:hypothetical protein